jgi:hypothetical protein
MKTLVVAAVLLLLGCGGTTNLHKEHEQRLVNVSQWNGYCGTERSDVKHATDAASADIRSIVHSTTIAKLASLARPSNLQERTAPEKRIFKLTASLEFARLESDGDWHLGLKDDQGNTMIAEAVPPQCASQSRFLPRIKTARTETEALATVTLPVHVTVTGILFFDFYHHQNYVARNAVELHPILSIAYTGSCGCLP